MQEITYLMVNYNQEKYLADCFASLHQQTNSSWKALIYDDASTDNSLKVIKKSLSPKIKLYSHKENKGKFFGLKKLVEKADTELLAILDPDDCLLPIATEEILRFYQKNPQTQWSHSHYLEMDNNLQKKIRIRGQNIPETLSYLAFGNITHLLVFQKSIFQKIQFSSGVYFAEDKDLIYRLEEQSPPAFIPKVLYQYRTTPNSATKSKKNRETGVKNHWKVQHQTLERRQIQGVQKKLYQILFFLITLYYPYRFPFPIRAGFWVLHRTCQFLFRPFLKNNFRRKT